ncbi:hypothetical protein COF76_13730 [Bacillus wiedmannii]|nr:hypothetical protein COF76_13730 [Bacillus wiedmannii]
MLFISSATLCNIFQQNSTNLIVTSNGFQFGYIFVTVMLHQKKKETSRHSSYPKSFWDKII